MKREIISDKNYIEAFNQGYELSKELGLKRDILKDLAAGNNRMQAMLDGMDQYAKELTKEKDIIPPLDLDSIETQNVYLENQEKTRDRDLDIDV